MPAADAAPDRQDVGELLRWLRREPAAGLPTVPVADAHGEVAGRPHWFASPAEIDAKSRCWPARVGSYLRYGAYPHAIAVRARRRQRSSTAAGLFVAWP